VGEFGLSSGQPEPVEFWRDFVEIERALLSEEMEPILILKEKNRS